MKSAWRVVVGLLSFWLMVLLYMSTTLYQSSDVTERAERQLSKALQELDALKKQNGELQKLANELRDIRVVAEHGEMRETKDLRERLDEANRQVQEMLSHQVKGAANSDIISNSQVQSVNEPDLAQEKLRRRTENGVEELWYYLKQQLGIIQQQTKDSPAISSKISNMLEDGADQKRTIMADLFNLSNSNDMGEWRQAEAEALSDLVQSRIHALQNPKDCSTAKKLVCNLNKGCGYGCQIHHMVYCFLIAFGTQRTLILESRGWRYSQAGWEKVFKPLSDTCTNKDGKSSRTWGPAEIINRVQVVELPIVDSLRPRPPYMPLAIPEDIAPRLMRLHGNPAVWWIGQFLKYSLKPQPELQHDIDESYRKLGIKSPIVGVHVRRTDKVGTEAAFHSIDEYMSFVEEYFLQLEKQGQELDERRVYLATDDPNLLSEARNKFPNYVFISDNEFARTAGLGTRYSDASLRGIILDIHFLSITDYLVCTFSSQVCRLAYEIMQTLHPDASTWFHSLDDIYYYGGQNAHNLVALQKHIPRGNDEIELQPGDLIGVAGNHWNGYSKGMNRRTGKNGLFPSYKVEDKIELVKYPTYSISESKSSKLKMGTR